MSDVRTDDLGPWLSPEDLDRVRRQVPMVYLDLVPVRLDTDGSLVQIGLLLRQPREGGVWRALVSGRVLLHETIREAIARHIEKDLGPMALPGSRPRLNRSPSVSISRRRGPPDTRILANTRCPWRTSFRSTAMRRPRRMRCS